MSVESDLEGRIGRLEDAAAIRELPDRYAQAYGALDLDTLAELYADDVLLGSGERGRDLLLDRFRSGCAGERGVRLAVLHVGTHVVEPVVDVAGASESADTTDTADGQDIAAGRILCHAEVERADGSWFHQAIHYGDRYVRTADGWRFGRQRRHELVYGAEPLRRPNPLPPADWPEHDVGRGTVPDRWSSWSAFWSTGGRPD